MLAELNVLIPDQTTYLSALLKLICTFKSWYCKAINGNDYPSCLQNQNYKGMYIVNFSLTTFVFISGYSNSVNFGISPIAFL